MAKGKVLDMSGKTPAPEPEPAEDAAVQRSATQTNKICPLLTKAVAFPIPHPMDPKQIGFMEHVSQVNCDRQCALFNTETDGCSFHAASLGRILSLLGKASP